MPHTFHSPTVIPTPDVHRGQLWKDDVLKITYRVIMQHAIGVDVKCISDETGAQWQDRLPREAFEELTLVN